MGNLINQLEKYLWETLGIRVYPLLWVESKSLPQYLRDSYRFYEASVLGNSCILMADVHEEEKTPAIVTKHMDYIKAKYGLEPVYVHRAVTTYNRKRLIQQKVSFVVPGKQLYLPTLGIDLREHVGRLRQKKQILSPAAHVLVLYVLWQKRNGTLTPAKTASDLGYSAMTMTRVFDELETAGLGEQSTTGKERHLRFAEAGRLLWDQALPFLDTPVKRRKFVNAPVFIRQGILAGQSALAEFTDLVEPKTPVLAFSNDEWMLRKQDYEINELAYSEPESYEIELWKYSPTRFAKEGIVDRLSLYLSMKNNPDERVQTALDELLEGVEW